MSNGSKRCLGVLLVAAVLVSTAIGLSTVATAGTPTTDGLIGWWRLDDGVGGTAVDLAAGANGALSAPDGWSTEFPYSVDRVTHSLDFSSDARALTFTATVPYFAPANVTLSAWVKWNGLPTGGHAMPIIYHGNSSTDGYGLYLDPSGRPAILIGLNAWLQTPMVLPTGVWTHLTATEDGAGNWTVYANGMLVANFTAVDAGGLPNVPTSNLFVGGQSTMSNGLPIYEHFHGVIADARLYGRALAQPEIAQVAAVYPVITGISPSSGPEVGGTTVTISGSGFSGATAVTFGGQTASSFSGNDTTLVATAPTGVGTAHVTVSTLLGGTSNTVAADQFTYEPPVASTTTLTASPSTSTYGDTVNLTAQVSASQTPTGTVTFADGGVPLGTAVPLDGAGQATLSTATLGGGSHSITATYSGDAYCLGSISSQATVTVGAAPTSIALAASSPTTVYGQPATLSATVSSGVGTPVGQVTFYDGGAPLGTVDLTAGSATLTTSTLSVNSHTLYASYLGATNYDTSASSTVSLTVAKADTTSLLSSSLNPSTYGQAVTLTATIVPNAPGGGVPTGTVTFAANGSALGTATLSAGQATFTTSTLPVGASMLTVTYGEDASFRSSTSIANSQAVNKVPSTAEVTTSANPSVFGQSITLTAHLSSGAGVPTGTVIFSDGPTTLGSATLASGDASLTTASLAVGTHTIAARYVGTLSYGEVTATQSLVITQADTATVLTSSSNPSTIGQNVTLTAAVTPVAPGAGTPTGTVTFFADGTPLGTATLTAGQATLSTAALSRGSHSLTATYAGDLSFNGSAATPVTQAVDAVTTTTTLTVSPNPAPFGQTVNLTASVVSGVGIPTGTVTFMDMLTPLGAPVPLDGFGQAALSINTLSTTTHRITAIYSGDATNAISTSVEHDTVIVPAATTTTVTATPNPAAFGQAVALTATVTTVAPGSGVPVGLVTFTDGATVLGSAMPGPSGQATLTTTVLSAGPHTITAAFGGSMDRLPSAGSVDVAIANPPDPPGNTTPAAHVTEGSQAIIPVTPAPGVDPSRIVAYYVVDGREVIVPLSSFVNGQLQFMAPTTATFYTREVEVEFADTDGHWAQDAIGATAARGLFNGTGNDRFEPDSQMTRGMLVTALARLDGVDLSQFSGSGFADVPTDSWYSPAVAWASQSGVVNGVGGNRFAPDERITREEIAAMIRRYMEHMSLSLAPDTDGPTFVDGSAVSNWASDAVEAMRELGIVLGRPDGRFDPQGDATRAECSAMLQRLINAILSGAAGR